jgi:hypothetical protein
MHLAPPGSAGSEGSSSGSPASPPAAPPPPHEVLRRVFSLLEAMEEAQRVKVLDLARRLVPTLTAEDIRNPHDFPDLDDSDWHFEDGQLAGIQSVVFALRGLASDLLADGEERGARERRQGVAEAGGEGGGG